MRSTRGELQRAVAAEAAVAAVCSTFRSTYEYVLSLLHVVHMFDRTTENISCNLRATMD